MIDSLSKLLLWKPTSAVCSSLHQLYSSSSTNSQAGIVQLLCTSVLDYYQLVHYWFHSWFTCLIIISYYLSSNKLLLKVFFFKNSPRSLISTQGQFLLILEKFGSDLSEHNFLLFSIHQTLQFSNNLFSVIYQILFSFFFFSCLQVIRLYKLFAWYILISIMISH